MKKGRILTKEETVNVDVSRELKAQLDERTNRWKRALADYQNLQKRVEEEKQDFVKFAAKQFIQKLLPIVDDLEKASAHLNDQGLKLVLTKLNDILKQEAVERIVAVGKDFDIKLMEAVSVSDGDEDNKVVSEVSAGYLMHGSILRPAQVIVSKKTK